MNTAKVLKYQCSAGTCEINVSEVLHLQPVRGAACSIYDDSFGISWVLLRPTGTAIIQSFKPFSNWWSLAVIPTAWVVTHGLLCPSDFPCAESPRTLFHPAPLPSIFVSHSSCISRWQSNRKGSRDGDSLSLQICSYLNSSFCSKPTACTDTEPCQEYKSDLWQGS